MTTTEAKIEPTGTPIDFDKLAPAKLEGTHVDAVDGDVRELLNRVWNINLAVAELGARALDVSTQHDAALTRARRTIEKQAAALVELRAAPKPLEGNAPAAAHLIQENAKLKRECAALAKEKEQIREWWLRDQEETREIREELLRVDGKGRCDICTKRGCQSDHK
jgi:hypothetical protein